MERIKKIHLRKSQGIKIITFFIILLAAAQVWFLYSHYKEIITKLPKDLFVSPKPIPISEFIVNSHYVAEDKSKTEKNGKANADLTENSQNNKSASLEESVKTIKITTNDTNTSTIENNSNNLNNSNLSSDSTSSGSNNTTSSTVGSNEFELTEIQKKIILRVMKLLDEKVEYGYKVYPDSGYPSENLWISTDVISIVLRDVGYDLMELIYNDMLAHKEDYPLDKIKKRKDPIKYIDFRDVFFQEKFFKRNALELSNEYIIGNKDNNIQWQPGDIVYFQFDPDNPYMDLGGFISSRKNDQGVPLIIMISKELGKISEVDKLLEYKVVGHYRYPNPYEEQ